MEPGGQLDMQQLLAAAQQMQEQLMDAQQELADAEVEGTAGGGLVTAVVNGQGELLDLTIRPDAIDPDNPEESAQTIADLVLAAVRDANRSVMQLQQEAMNPLAAGFGAGGFGEGGGFPGFGGVPGMPGIISGAAEDEDDDDEEEDDEDAGDEPGSDGPAAGPPDRH
ncbi:MAG TPA: YbaB/EbfC family nucleoid-associated protein [Streptosporangiaceae bacterium]|nr:YbaB/EbfC family nucleoid-associated protein [Streptosporangiaceae bacterium]